MIFAKFDLGAILQNEAGLDIPNIIRFDIGNPLIMNFLNISMKYFSQGYDVGLVPKMGNEIYIPNW
jgi:hypothetical protein